MMMDEILTAFIGRAPTPADRAIYKDQEQRLAQLNSTLLLPMSDRLQVVSPFDVPQK